MYNLFLIIVLSKMFSYLYTSVVWKLCCILRNDKHPAKYLMSTVGKKCFFSKYQQNMFIRICTKKILAACIVSVFIIFTPLYFLYYVYARRDAFWYAEKGKKFCMISLDSNQCVKIKMNISCQDQKCYKFSVIKTFVWYIRIRDY